MAAHRFQRDAAPRRTRLELLVALLEAGPDVVLVVDRGGRIQHSFGPVHNLAPGEHEISGRDVRGLVRKQDLHRLERLLASAADVPLPEEVQLRAPDSPWRVVELLARPDIVQTGIGDLVLTVRDISARKDLEERLKSDAMHDPLTKLPNRSLFADRLSQALERQRRRQGNVAVLFIDVDDFKSVNDRFGHEAGDELITAIASRINALLRTGDSAARLGGDEFAILLEEADQEAAVKVAKRVLGVFEAPFALKHDLIDINISIGIAASKELNDTGSELLRRADMAMYASKTSGRSSYDVFQERTERVLRGAKETTEPTNVVQIDRARREREEINALLEDPAAVEVVYQPIVDLASGRVAGYEALARFGGNGDTESTFAQAHRCGLGSFLEAKALLRALEVSDRPSGTFLSLNLSPTALLSREVQKALPADLDDVVIEITEQELAPLAGLVREAVVMVRRRGARLAIDDAGAGYAGLKHLMDYSPDLIKLDRSLVQGSHQELHKGALVESLVRYAHRIGASTCAEGVEEGRDLDFITGAGIDYVQGFLLARPGLPWIAVKSLGATHASHQPPAPHTPRERLVGMLESAARWEDVDAVLALVAMTVGAEQAYLSRFEPAENYVLLVAAHGDATFDMPYPLAEYPTSAAVLETGRPREVSIHDPHADSAESELLIAEGMAMAFLQPVQVRGESVGLLELYASRQREWSSEERDYLQFVSAHLGTALERMQQSRSLAPRAHA